MRVLIESVSGKRDMYNNLPSNDGKGVVLSLLRTREGSNILAEAYFYICFFLFQFISFQGRGSGREDRHRSRPNSGSAGGEGG